MKKPRRTPEQIAAIFREIAVAPNRPEILRRYGISRRTFYRWKARFAQSWLGDGALVGRLKEENERLRAVVAEQAMRLHVIEQMLAAPRRPRRPSRRSASS